MLLSAHRNFILRISFNIFWKVGAKDSMNKGERIFLPISVQGSSPVKKQPKYECSEAEMNFIRSLELYKVGVEFEFWLLYFVFHLDNDSYYVVKSGFCHYCHQ